MSSHPFGLERAPALDEDARARSRALGARLRERISAAGGSLGFDDFMEAALYEPGLGYYRTGLGGAAIGGDFTTAPEISPLFARCLAAQLLEITCGLDHPEVLELGAGSGRMAAGILDALGAQGALPHAYRILELSAPLVVQQRARLQPLAERWGVDIRWLDRLPDPPFEGVIIANEVVDALPAKRFVVTSAGPRELRVGERSGAFVTTPGPLGSGLTRQVEGLEAKLGRRLPAGYQSELRPVAGAWLKSCARSLARGAILIVDYGYDRREYYHPQRDRGTLQCHYRHRAHGDPYALIGLQDITVSVDFSVLADAALDAGLTLAGYTNQAWFLIGNGILTMLEQGAARGSRGYLEQAAALKTLTLPGAMGELVKVAAFTRGPIGPLAGFADRDQRDRL